MKKLIVLLCTILCTSFFSYDLSAQVLRVVNNKVGILNNNPTFQLDVAGDIRGSWFRSTGSKGLYSQTYATYMYPVSGHYWRMRSDRGLDIRNKANLLKGRLYHDNASGFGLTDKQGHWAVRIQHDSFTSFVVNNDTKMAIYNTGRVKLFAANDANKNAGTGVLEVAGELRVDGNEIITNSAKTLYLQYDNVGDLSVDNTTLVVDASANTIRTPKIIDVSNTSYYLDPSHISRMAYVYPRVNNTGYVGSNTNRWSRGYFTNMHRVNEHVLSDARVKENISSIDNALEKVLSLTGKIYNYKKEILTQTSSELSRTPIISTEQQIKTASANKNTQTKSNSTETLDEATEPSTKDGIVEDEMYREFEDAVPSDQDLRELENLQEH